MAESQQDFEQDSDCDVLLGEMEISQSTEPHKPGTCSAWGGDREETSSGPHCGKLVKV